MSRLYLSLPYHLQLIVVNFVSLIKLILRRSISYSSSYEYYSSFFNHDPMWQKTHIERVKARQVEVETIASKLGISNELIVNKNFVKSNYQYYVRNSILALKAKTSGSTGNGLSFKKSFFSERDTYAAYDAFRAHHGVLNTDWCGYFGGNLIVKPGTEHVCHIAYPTKQIIFSQYNLSNDTVHKYINQLNHYKPKWIHGYPSFLLELIRLAKLHRLKLSYCPILITTGSETITFEQCEIIKYFFNASLRDLYCQTEMVAMIYECKSSKYHVNRAYSDVLFKNVDHKLYKIIGSNLNNDLFPLFSYDTEDLAVISSFEVKCECGSDEVVIDKIIGRSEDYLQLPNDVRVGRLDHIFKGNHYVYQAQFIQDRETLETQLYVKVDELNFNLDELNDNIGLYLPGLKVNVLVVDYIKPEKNGKIKFVKQI